MSPKFVAICNFIIALLGVGILFSYFSLTPKIDEIYSSLGQQEELSFRAQFLIVTALSAANVFFGFSLLFSKYYTKESYFQPIIVFTIISFVLMGYFSQQLITIAVEPIYTVTE
ncbi:MAG: hypothetical protein QG639_930 [Patescibacteria group bacterium]|jgi:hypothetical protein|nr:hypothetical protein [Patescibacteria group bacterium]